MVHDLVLIRLKGGAADYNLDLGFIPKFVKVTVMSATNPDVYKWFGEMMEDSSEASASSWEYGIKITGSDGIQSYMDTVAKGISAYDGAKTPQVYLTNPGTGLKEKADIADWAAATNYSTGERTATAVGTVVRPPTHNGKVFELTTDTSTGGSEPSSWDVEPGVTVTDGGGNIWTCRVEEIVANKGLGITLGGTLLENDKIAYVECYRAIRCEDIGDIG